MDFISKEKLKIMAESFNVVLDETALDRFDTYAQLLAQWNEKINLTAITDPKGIMIKHFVDSIALFKYADIPNGAKCIDVGTGAGFPGVAMMIARPDLKVTLLDSTGKKLNVIADILSHIGLDAEILHSRAEEAGRKAEYREKFDFATARAVANLRELSEYCLPFVKQGGCFIALKGARADEEISGAKKAIAVLGGKIEAVNSFNLEDAGERNIIIIRKNQQTPTKYPRQSAKIAKFPLE
ncbi:MAG: 16S rRNA (guanine(527)-N(7))-methyltransferase RsmG [Ruminococcus sp.]|nr:16S rRNA (guanine(527)-N(7))-methyltransferase RsmG [Ruminococcus sp.]